MYQNRQQAGQRLAEHLAHYRDQKPLILALPRGGVVVGYELAIALDAPLDVLVVRKVGAPHNPELALGAIASYEAEYFDERTAHLLGVSRSRLMDSAARERVELHRREAVYRGNLPPPAVKDRTVILVDDGLATGSTARAAIQALRSLAPRKVVLAVPVAPPDTVAMLQKEVDELVCPQAPPEFSAVGQWYREFAQTTDEEVIALLQRRRAAQDAGNFGA